MKKIVGGKLYDTETAVVCGVWNNEFQAGDDKACQETLYRTKNGSWFLRGKGGDSSVYHRGPELRPLEEYEARDWAEEHLSADAYMAAFGEVEAA